MAIRARYRIVIDGFKVTKQTQEDEHVVHLPGNEVLVTQPDGPGDEVSIATSFKLVARNGDVLEQRVFHTPVIRRLKEDEFFPRPAPWSRVGDPDPASTIPPFTVQEFVLEENESVAFFAPSMWERDIAAGIEADWLRWHEAVDKQYGERAKRLLDSAAPVTAIIDAASEGFPTLTIPRITPPGLGQSRPIGVTSTTEAYSFSPKILPVDYRAAGRIAASEGIQGVRGTLYFSYYDEYTVSGHYTLFIRLERMKG